MKFVALIFWLIYAGCLGAFEHILYETYHIPTDLMILSWVMLFILGWFGFAAVMGDE